MEEIKNLAEQTEEISNLLLDSLTLLELLEDVVDGEQKEYFLVSAIQKNIDKAFCNIEDCRRLISIPN